MKVYVLKEDYFDKVVEGAPGPCVVKFTSSGCHLCHELKPIFKEAAKKYYNKFIFFNVNCDEEEGLRQKFSDDGVPTIRVYNKNPREGFEIPYPGDATSGYTLEDLINFLDSYGAQNG